MRVSENAVRVSLRPFARSRSQASIICSSCKGLCTSETFCLGFAAYTCIHTAHTIMNSVLGLRRLCHVFVLTALLSAPALCQEEPVKLEDDEYADEDKAHLIARKSVVGSDTVVGGNTTVIIEVYNAGTRQAGSDVPPPPFSETQICNSLPLSRTLAAQCRLTRSSRCAAQPLT